MTFQRRFPRRVDVRACCGLSTLALLTVGAVSHAQDNLLEGKTFLCPSCGYAARDYRPVACPVCDLEGPKFEQIDRKVLEALSRPHACSMHPWCMEMWRGPVSRPGMGREAIRTQPPRCQVPRLCMGESVSTAFVTLNARAHDCFGLFEPTRAAYAAARERTGILGASAPMYRSGV